MKHHFLLGLILGMLCAVINVHAMYTDNADWYLYVWSENTSGDLGQFVTTDANNIFVIQSCNVPVEGIKFCVRNGSWSLMYGWKDASVTETGTEVELTTANGANGWLALPVGRYKVTFNSSALTIRFDEPEEEPDPEDPEPAAATYLIGGDLTMATYMEDWGTVFRYKDGSVGDVFDILESYGVNLARLRLYHTPGTAIKSGGNIYRTPVKSPRNNWEGYPYAGADDILSLAKRAKVHNMKLCLSIYLSDYWAGATEQYIPGAWKDVTSHSVLCDSVENYVRAYMLRMKDEGIYPEYVSIGNESNYGILFTDLNGNKITFGGHTDNMSQCVALFNRAYDAVKEVSPTSQVIIHHSYGDNGKTAICRNFFKNLKDNGCKFDIVGGSYYPHWAQDHKSSDCTPTGMLEWAQDMEDNIGKPVMLMEVGYSWAPYRPNEKNGGDYYGQLKLNGCYNEASEAGQEEFIKSLHEALVDDEEIIGYMYWDPIFVDQKVNNSWTEVCWAEMYDATYNAWWQDGNIISNTTLFDYEGKPLSALHREINSRKPATTPTGVECSPASDVLPQSAMRCQKVVRDGQLLFLHDGRIYNALGQEVR